VDLRGADVHQLRAQSCSLVGANMEGLDLTLMDLRNSTL
jgi:uncharacterized protein YjbI with pentapeptide repeats